MAQPIPYGHQYIDESDVAAVAAALRGEWLTTGPTVAAFEAEIAAIAGTDDAVVVTSGTAALHVAYAAAGVTSGDQVIVPALTFAATASTASLLGAEIVFADVEEDTGNIDPESVAALATERTAVISAVDYAGHPADIDVLLPIARAAGALVLEDAAHSIGSTLRERPVGSLADLTTFSFFPTKNMTTAEGGAVVSNSEALITASRGFRGHGLVRDRAEQRYPNEGPWHQEIHKLGLNYRLPDVLCALGVNQIRRLAEFKASRTAVFERYQDGLGDLDGLTLPTKRSDVDPMWHLFPVRVHDGRRREVFERLREEGILVQVNYMPVYWHPYYEDLGYRRGLCPVAERYYSEEISLPMYAHLDASDQDRVIEALRSILA
ncbi:DegT/DnrJ/EryC1/StrS aminotransferase family protein [Microbacterium sp. KSW4-16]|uniref:DegT/DnrJ/EryC1/StrS family aminotransferase n=1 Tax=Microbacterium TaxID=33882 RepID=UPI00103EF0F3|nr:MULTISPECIES: aminotransferase class I/II-fold pyridoxal phosphate-dependent enzyme [Microbacterium]MCK8466488.1 DegT/DnrJ/EryC1/StrS aminotransferase family protein [Microbacterium aurugineum]TCJ27965.1 aminotransferase class I/II-fold pyridoxal phosphate-dependent enzyme [Microbacterium sp. PI-1]